MKLKSLFTQDLAIDLGTANTVVMSEGNIILDEPSIVAIDVETEKVLAIGQEAQRMHGKTHKRIETIRPLKDGVIADFRAAELFIKELIKKVRPKKYFFSPMLKLVIAIPSGSTDVERRAVKDSSEQAGANEVYLVYEPLAAAIGLGIDIEAPEGNMIIDIGGGTTEIAVISLAGIVTCSSIKIAGDVFTKDIMDYMQENYHLRINETIAEEIKISVGAALTDLDDPPPDKLIVVPAQQSPIPIEQPVSYTEIANCLNRSIERIEAEIGRVLEKTPPELYREIVKNGIFLTGGGSLLRGLDKRFTEKFQIQFKRAEKPLLTVAKGVGIILEEFDKFQSILIK